MITASHHKFFFLINQLYFFFLFENALLKKCFLNYFASKIWWVWSCNIAANLFLKRMSKVLNQTLEDRKLVFLFQAGFVFSLNFNKKKKKTLLKQYFQGSFKNLVSVHFLTAF